MNHFSLEPDHLTRNSILQKIMNYGNQFLDELPEMPGYVVGAFDKLNSLKIRDECHSLDSILDILETEVDRVGINTASGRHLGFIPGGGLWTSAVADYLAALTNRYAGIAYSNPPSVKIEEQVLRWMINLMGYPDEAYGNLTSGGSIANLIAIQVARDYHQIHPGVVNKAVIYLTDHTHHCVEKALHITGLSGAIIRKIPLNEKYQMSTAHLAVQIMEDKEQGLQPFLLVGSAGTTDTGTIDDLSRLAEISRKNNIWFHVDAAYGGFFQLTDEGIIKLKGIESSDSLVLDPHKTLFIPYGSGAVLIRNRQYLLASNSKKATYLHETVFNEEISPSDTGPELSRHNRGLRVWLPLVLHGVQAFRSCLNEKLMLTRYLYRHLRQIGFETGPDPDLSILVFRVQEEGNELTQNLLELIHRDGRVFLSSTIIDGKLWIRCAIVSHRTHKEELDLALQMLKENLRKLERPNNSSRHLPLTCLI